MPIPDPKISVCMTIRKSLHQNMVEVSKRTDRSVSWIANAAIQDWLAATEQATEPAPTLMPSKDDGLLQIED